MDKKGRWAALDALRGLAILFMLPINAGMDFVSFPAWMKHAPGTGMTLADFVMPAFLFALGLSQARSLARRRGREGLWRIILHAFIRYGLLFAFGSVGFFLVWKGSSWEILQMLGLCGALAFPFLFLPPGWRSLAVILATGLIESLRPVLLEPSFRLWYDSGIGGPAGTFPLATLVIAASVVGEDLWERPPLLRAGAAAVLGILVGCAGLALAPWIAPDKHLLSLSYLLVASGTASLGLGLLELVSVLVGQAKGKAKPVGNDAAGIEAAASGEPPEANPADLPILGSLGRNALLAYMGGGVLTLALRAFLPATASQSAAWAASLGVLAFMTLVCLVLDRKGIYLKL